MAISGITGGADSSIFLKSTSSSNSTSSKASSDSSTLTLSGFYKLLAAQLQNQSMYDSSTDNSQYITQMVQFAMLSQMQSMTNSVDSSTALSMVGKTVNLSSTNADGTSSTSSGTVDSVTFSSGTPYLYVNGESYKLSDVTSVKSKS